MFNCTEAFLTRHVRNLATEGIEDNQAAVVHRAGIILQARVEEFGHQYPNTVMFMYPVNLGAIRDFIGPLGANTNFNYVGRIPWIITWEGVGHYSVTQNASGFSGSTNGAGLCNHYDSAGVIHDASSVVTDWNAPGLGVNLSVYLPVY